MEKIEKFNHYLNISFVTDKKLHNVFTKSIQELLAQFIPHVNKHENALFIGAGKLHDIDLEYIGHFFKSLHFTDIDIFSTIEALKAYPFLAEKVVTTRIEYTGYENSGFFDRFSDLLLHAKAVDQLEKGLKRLIEKSRGYRFLKQDDDHYDLIYVSPIYTQLIYQQVMMNIGQLREQGVMEHMLKFAETFMLDEMTRIIHQFNENLVRVLNRNGMMVVLSDIFELDPKSQFAVDATKAISEHTMDRFYQDYLETYGYGLGDYGLLDLSDMLEAKTHQWLIWPHDSKKYYVIKIIIYKNKEA